MGVFCGMKKKVHMNSRIFFSRKKFWYIFIIITYTEGNITYILKYDKYIIKIYIYEVSSNIF